MREDFITLLKDLRNTAFIPFYGCDIVLVKYSGKYYFFEKNIPPRCGEITPQSPIKGLIATLPSDNFIRYIIQKIYKNGMNYDEFRIRANGGSLIAYRYPIVSQDVFRTYSRPPFYYYLVWTVEVETAEEVYKIIEKECLVPETSVVRNLDSTPVSERVMRRLRDLGTNFKEIFVSLFGQKKTQQVETTAELAEKQLLNCDKIRCDLPPYEKLLLTAADRGHWEVTEELAKFGFKRRDPRLDVNNSVVGIDFGTRSTVVYYRNMANQILPLAVGSANFSYDSKERYENPTILRFVSYDKFFKSYKDKEGRPDTKWEHLQISHTAKEAFKRENSKNYCAYLSEIKQWASGNNSIVIDPLEDSSEKDVPTFLEIEPTDFNPIEIYAYYIGLYINRMNPQRSIYMNYYLSYPVTCEEKVRERIRLSFERGLKQSLPASLREDSEEMKKFKVTCEISEPMAYAASALKEFGFKGAANYAVFDFGGGTTDYDFGRWEPIANNKKYTNQIESFGGQGISTCGGENILLDLSFDIFKRNIKQTNAEGKIYPFLQNTLQQGFIGDKDFCPGTSQARKNTRILMEILRPFWEQSALYLDKAEYPEDCKESSNKELGDIEISLTLYDREGEPKPNMSIFTNRADIKDFIKSKIEVAIDGFFTALDSKVDHFSGDTVNIFLAGNSSKSPYVTEIFERKIGENKNELQLELYPPLGKDAESKIKERIGDYAFRDDSPTCKSGVAYGLILCRQGGKIKVVKNQESEQNFKYYIGLEGDSGNFVLLDTVTTNNKKPEFNKWYDLFEADTANFEFYYTDQASALKEDNTLIADGQAKMLPGIIPESDVDDTKLIFIRAVSSHRIEYAVADSCDSIDEKNVKSIDF